MAAVGTAKSSGVSQGSSGSLGSSGSSGFCSFYIHDILLGASDDQMIFSVTNDGTVALEVTAILSLIGGGVTLTGPVLPAFILTGATATFTVNSDPAFTDLRGTTFTVQTSCGDQSDVFPVA